MSKVSYEQMELLSSPVRENFEESFSRSIDNHGIHIKKQNKQKDLERMQLLLDDDVDIEAFESWVKEDGKKYICKTLFNSEMSAFEAYHKELRLLRQDRDNFHEGDHYMNEEDGKLLQGQSGDHTPAHPAHFNKGLGENAGFVTRNNHGYVWQLFADGYLRKIELAGVKSLLFQRYQIMVSDHEADKIAQDLNNDRLVFLGKSLQGDIGDSPMTKDAVSMITSQGKTNSLSYEATYSKGLEVRKVCSKLEHEAGKIIGKACVEGNSPELNSKTARVIYNFIQGTNQDMENILAQISKMAKNPFK